MPVQLPPDIKLSSQSHGWFADLDPSRGLFLGRPVRLTFDTADLPPPTTAPKPTSDELSLANTILEALPAVLRAATEQFLAYTANDPEAQLHVRSPEIWISREIIEDGSAWAFVVGRDDDSDFGYHVEFTGLQSIRVWAGD